MKYILIAIPVFILIVISMILGFITWTWTFKKKDFRKGCSFINERIGFTEWIENHY